MLAVPLFVPGIILTSVEKVGMLPTRKAPKTALELACLFIQLYFAVPLALGLFPRIGSIKAADLESEFRELKAKDGSLQTEFAFNKGL